MLQVYAQYRMHMQATTGSPSTVHSLAGCFTDER
jgi:hypothetical protein